MKYITNILILVFIFINTSSQNNQNVFTQFFYDDGKVSSEGIMKNGKPDGYWSTYYNSGIIKSEGLRTNYLLDSTWTFYNNKEELIKKINYLSGQKNGYSYSYSYEYNSEPVTVSKELFLNNKKEGKSFYFYENGIIKEEIFFKEGKKEGFAREYNTQGELFTIMQYRNNYLVSLEKVNRIDGEGKKQGIWKEYFENGKLCKEIVYIDNEIDGFYREYNEKGSLVLILKYEKGVIIEEEEEIMEQQNLDIKREFGSNGELTFQGSYRKNIPVGVHRFYDNQGEVVNSKIYNDFGILTSEGILDETGRKKGFWKEYYLSGEVRAKGNYLSNKKTGLWTYLYLNGNKEQEGDFLSGLPDGMWTWFYISGKLHREEGYFNGREDGKMIEYSESGKIISSGKFINGEKEGDWSYFSGDHIEKGSYITGLREGVWHYYYLDDKLHFEGKFIQGLAQGKHKFYYPSGIIKEERYFDMGIREKNWKKYDSFGNVKMTITYKHNTEYRINGEKINLPEGSFKTIK